METRVIELESGIKLKEADLKQREVDLSKLEDAQGAQIGMLKSEIEGLKSALSKLDEDKADLIMRIGQLNTDQEAAEEKVEAMKEKKEVLEKASLEKMYQWIKVHQNPRTGLIASFEGDRSINDQAFTYDQALAVIIFTRSNDFEAAAKILNFYLSKAEKAKGFYNGYYVLSGETAEYLIHSGPNLWLGIAVLQYTHKARDNRYLPIARDIANWMMNLQHEDNDQGLRGGPEVSWFSTEHNIDGFAFFNMFYQWTQEVIYQEAGEGILSWLKKHAYDGPDVPIKRGKSDATIATDTYAWSIASLGPKRLISMGMDPEAVMRFAEENCGVSVEYLRPNGEQITIKGFDFAKGRHIGRGGVISCEWTAQMALSYKILSRYFAGISDREKEKVYKDKADEYLEELSKMVISSPSRTGQGQGCLPYASSDFVDTGHGWMTPKGRDTGSVSATIYTILAYRGFNPLELKEE